MRSRECRYGVTNIKSLGDTVKKVCDVFDEEEAKALSAFWLVSETIMAETDLSLNRTPARFENGVGLCQMDRIAFDDVKNRTRQKYRDLAVERFGVDIDKIELRDLAFSPLLSIIFCRLFYKLIPEQIPQAERVVSCLSEFTVTDVEERAAYWKKYYNTKYGAGTVEEYVEKAMIYSKITIL